MDNKFEELCIACRTGDLPNVDKLIAAGVNLNLVDRFDNSPLFLASLCGHEEVVRLLLRSGAICDRDRYEGARCIYGALTDSIRDLLLSYDISKAVDMNQPFATHISSLLNTDTMLNTFDVTFKIPIDENAHCSNTSSDDGKFTILKAHIFMIQARCPKFFGVVCEGSDSMISLKIKPGIPAYIIDFLLKFIYLVPTLHTIKPEDYNYLSKLAVQLEMVHLARFLDKARHIADPSEKSALMLHHQYQFTSIAKEQLSRFVDKFIIQQSFTEPAESNGNLFKALPTYPSSADLFLRVKDDKGFFKVYPCHLAVLIRSDYFRSMFRDPFRELITYSSMKDTPNNSDSKIQLLDLPPCKVVVLEMIIRYLYYDESDVFWNYAMDVIRISDFFLIERLKSISATVITQSKEILRKYSIFDLLYFSWHMRLDRLEQYTAKYVAIHIRSLCHEEGFKDAIIKSSERISTRQETDTIEFVDDIRFYLLDKYNFEPEDIPFFEAQDAGDRFVLESGFLEYKQDMSLVDDILQDLNLNA